VFRAARLALDKIDVALFFQFGVWLAALLADHEYVRVLLNLLIDP
jgi:hypothetical protein